jgi:[protein-PII] uridylyltransferase
MRPQQQDHGDPRGAERRREVLGAMVAARERLGRLECTSHEYAAAIDAVVLASAEGLLPEGHALLALGGYGRREMAPLSDVDLLFLVPTAGEASPAAEPVLAALWSTGTKVGYATRDRSESSTLATEDLRTAMAHLDARFLAGDRAAAEALQAALWGDVYAPRASLLREALEAERDARHTRLADSVFLLEPDVKLGRGGLRDVHAVRWAARLCGAFGELGHSPLAGIGITEDEAEAFERAATELLRIRCALHAVAGRRTDRLLFAHQEGVAARVGARDVADAMQRYWRAAGRVYALSGRVFRQLQVESGGPSGPWAPSPSAFEPETLAGVFRSAAESGLPIHPAVLRRVAETLPRVNEETRTHPRVRDDLHAVLLGPGAQAALEAMHEIGLLPALVPEFRALTGRYQRNVFHLYTVDVHTLHALGELQRLVAVAATGLLTEFEVEVMASLDADDRRVLAVATLLHDIDKGGLHPSLAAGAASRLGLSDDDAALVERLVRGHLALALLAQMRDIHDPATQRQLAREVGDLRVLRILFLLTHADMSSTNPDFYTPWKRALLQALFRATEDRLLHDSIAGEVSTARPSRHEPGDLYADPRNIARERRRDVVRLLGADPDHPDASTRVIDQFLGQLPTRYFTAVSPEVISLHASLRAKGGVQVAFRADGPIAWTTIVCPDLPGLFYRFAGVFAARRLSLVRAEAFHTADGTAILELAVARPPHDGVGQRPAVPEALLALEPELEVVARGGEGPLERLRERERPSPFATAAPLPDVQVVFDGQTSPLASIVDIVAPDQAGLVFKAGRALAERGFTLELAFITIEGKTARLAFYVHDGGTPLSAERGAALIEPLRQAVASPL